MVVLLLQCLQPLTVTRIQQRRVAASMRIATICISLDRALSSGGVPGLSAPGAFILVCLQNEQLDTLLNDT